MKKNMDCLNFKAPKDMALFMNEVLNELQHSSPYNSYINALAKKEHESYRVSISIKYGEGEFATTTCDMDLFKAVQQSADAITSQIQKWHANRFV